MEFEVTVLGLGQDDVRTEHDMVDGCWDEQRCNKNCRRFPGVETWNPVLPSYNWSLKAGPVFWGWEREGRCVCNCLCTQGVLKAVDQDTARKVCAREHFWNILTLKFLEGVQCNETIGVWHTLCVCVCPYMHMHEDFFLNKTNKLCAILNNKLWKSSITTLYMFCHVQDIAIRKCHLNS